MKLNDTRTDQEILDELMAGNDPSLRQDVLAELARRGIEQINPFLLELSLKYAGKAYVRPKAWYEKKNRLAVYLRRELRKMSEAGRATWPDHAQEMVNEIMGSWSDYSTAYDLSDLALESQPHPSAFLEALQAGENAATVLLTICNTWMSKEAFRSCARILGSDHLLWDDARSLYWQDWRRHRPENLHLCEDITVEAAGLVAVEPFWIEDKGPIDYDLYGSMVADVTSFVVRFTPKEGVDPQELKKYVEAAVREFVDKGNRTFDEPTCAYTNPTNAYERFRRLKDEAFWNADAMARQLAFDMEERFLQIVHAYEAEHYDNDKERQTIPMLYQTTDAVKRILVGEEPITPLPVEMRDYVDATCREMENGHYASIAEKGDVVLKKTLILDDLLELYKFCDGFLTPSATVAHALDNARFAEECGPIKQAGDWEDRAYDSKYVALDNRLGNLSGTSPEQVIDKAHNDILVMLGMGKSTLQDALLQTAVLAQGTLTGRLPDGTGAYPALSLIADASRDGVLAKQDDLLTQRIRNMLERMAGNYGCSDTAIPIRDRFLQAAAMATEIAHHQEMIAAICDRYENDSRGYDGGRAQSRTNLFEQIRTDGYADVLAQERSDALACLTRGRSYTPRPDIRRDLLNALEGDSGKPRLLDAFDLSSPPPAHLDALGRYIWSRVVDSIQEQKAEEAAGYKPTPNKPRKEVAQKADLVEWGGAVGAQLPRCFEGTLYTTRSRGTPFARPGTELPPELSCYTEGVSRCERPALPDLSTVMNPPREP